MKTLGVFLGFGCMSGHPFTKLFPVDSIKPVGAAGLSWAPCAAVIEEILDRADVVASLEEVRGERGEKVSQRRAVGKKRYQRSPQVEKTGVTGGQRNRNRQERNCKLKNVSSTLRKKISTREK